MLRARLSLALALSAGLAIPALPAQESASEKPAHAAVTIYRCLGAGGAVALRDSPCLKDEKQEVRSMQRPRDPVSRAESSPPAATPVVAPREIVERVVYRSPPRPMYECVTPEGDTYTSDNGDGKPRWVPYWTLGYPVWPRGGGASVSGNIPIGNGNLSFGSGGPVPLPPTHPPAGRPPRPGVVLPAGGAWVRDECHALPQQEICARLSDRRYDILRRYTSAMPSERRTLDLEQRGIDARMANDCGNR
ncbi:DUF4124 domain-containing protein [Pseudoxanthomonas putridarboris]|uniref:DUF4124 domain-containing protein n=1 Tax=Pseudoxanthomonas putridarboris TaxID=752605 RepID=A0ABU9IVX3_9GAMM